MLRDSGWRDPRLRKLTPSFDRRCRPEVGRDSGARPVEDARLAGEDIVLCQLSRPSNNGSASHQTSVVVSEDEVPNEVERLCANEES
jgi:hypothetical protein